MNSVLRKKVFIYFLTVVILLPVFSQAAGVIHAESPTEADFGQLLDERKMELSPGATYTHQELKLNRGLEKIHKVEFDVSKNPNLELQPAMSEGKVLGMQPLSGMAKLVDKPGNRVIAGINGDFYDMSNGEPLGFFMGEGKILTSPSSNFAFGIKSDGSTVYGPPPTLTRYVTIEDKEIGISHINRTRSDQGALILYTEDFASSTKTNNLGNEVIAEIVEGEVKSGQTIKLRVVEINEDKGNSPLKPGQVVLSATGDFKEELSALQVDSELTATFELEDEWKDVVVAIGGYHHLIKDGNVVDHSSDDVNPRTAIGTKADGSIVMLQIDGRQPGFSEGVTLNELSLILKEMGVVDAINLDGGGSATLIARLPGQQGAELMNSPSDGGERSTANGLLLVNKASEGEQAAKLAISPVKERVLIGSSVTFNAAGVDSNGHPAPIGGNPTWDVNSEYGVIDRNGVFTANNKVGETEVVAIYDNISSSAEVEIVDQLTELVLPAEIKTYSANQREELTVAALRNGQVIQAKNSSFEWRVEGPIGSIDENGVFTAAEGTGLKGKIFVNYSDVEASMDVNVGKLPVILEDFENGMERYKEESGARYEKSIASLETDEEYVRSGNGALKLEYDFTGWPSTSGAYLEVKDASRRIEIPDYPEKIGMWVYGDGNKHWLRAQLRDANGGAIGIDFVNESTGVDWVGWRYLEAEVPQGRPAPLYLDMPVRYMETKADKKDGGVIYVDEIRAMYGPATEDLTPPTIKNISPEESSTVKENRPKIQVYGEVANYDPVENPATTLIDPDKIRMYVDDVLVKHTLYPPTGQIHYTPPVPLADGTHKVQVKIRDLTGNRTEKEWFFDVDTGSSKIMYDHPAEVYTGNTTSLNIKALKSSNISQGHIELQLDMTRAESIEVIPNDELSVEQVKAEVNQETGIVRIDFNDLTKAGLAAEDILAQLRYRVKKDATGDMQIKFVSGAFQLQETGDTEYSFYGHPVKAPIKHQLKLSWDEFGIVEGNVTTFTVTDAEGQPVEDAKIQTFDGTEIGMTGRDGTLQTSELTTSVKEYELQAVKDGKYSPIEKFVVSKLAGAEIPYNISVTMWEDPRTTKAFNWHTHPNVTDTFVEIVKKEEFTNFNANNVIRVEGRNSLFNTVDTGTIRVHKAEVTGLEPGTDYIYRVGDGNDKFSEQGTFLTASGTNTSTKFLFMGDSQANTKEGFALWGNTFEKALADHPDTEFVIHGGDLVEDGYKENEWDMWFDAAKAQLSNTTIVPVVGNHEVTGARQNEDYLAHFNHPQNGIDSLKGSNFSFDYNNAHFVVLNSEYDFEEQKEWLRTDLKNTNKQWKFVAFHRGPYGSIYDSEHIRKAWTPIFDEFEVDVVMNGHDHVYVRTWPMKDMKKAEDGKGTVYLVGGSSGPKFYQVVERDWQEVTFGEREQIYVAAEIINDEVKFVVKTINDQIVDEFTLVKTEGENGNDGGSGGSGGSGGGSGGSSGSGSTEKPEPNKPEPEDGKLTLKPIILEETKMAIAELSREQWENAREQAKENVKGIKHVQLELESLAADVTEYTLKMSGDMWVNNTDSVQLEFMTPFGSVTLSTAVIGDNVKAKEDDIKLSIKRISGQVFEVRLEVNGKVMKQTNSKSPLRIKLPYMPSDKPHTIIVKRNSDNNSFIIPNGRYDSKSEMIYLETNHFGQYSIDPISRTFEDITAYGWAKEAIEGLAARDVIKGTSQGKFSPKRDVTRAEFITMLVRALDLQVDLGSSFKDVNKNQYYYEPIAIARKLGIVQGTGDNRFKPDDSITRQELFTMTARTLILLDKLPTDIVDRKVESYDDYSSISSYAVDSMNALEQIGLIQGYANKLKPLESATRAETAVMIDRLLQFYVK